MPVLPPPPTVLECVHVYALIGRTLFAYQMQDLATICESPYVILQGPRQIYGKSELAALYLATCIVKGRTPIVGMPTLQQMSSTLLERLNGESGGFMRPLEDQLHLRRTKRQVQDTVWSNGGRLMVVGASETTRKGAQGRTGTDLWIDEGHDVFGPVMGNLAAFTNVAYEHGVGKTAISGIGGPEESVIELYKRQGYALARRGDEDGLESVVAERERAGLATRDLIAHHRETEAPEFFGQHYLVQPLSAGQRTIYADMLSTFPPPTHAGVCDHYFGIDVGRVRDYTCIAHLQHWPAWGVTHLVDFVPIPHGNFEDQAHAVYDYIDQFPWLVGGSTIACETNGLGIGLHDALQRRYFPMLQKVNVDEDKIHKTVQHLRVRFKQGSLQIGEPARNRRLGDPAKRLGELRFTIDPKGKCKYDHHDGNSALIVADILQRRVEAA